MVRHHGTHGRLGLSHRLPQVPTATPTAAVPDLLLTTITSRAQLEPDPAELENPKPAHPIRLDPPSTLRIRLRTPREPRKRFPPTMAPRSLRDHLLCRSPR
ncbi:hypothetical protein PGTUg99_003818 [Puccinia graminis f. sp. tritici]|uniref:Uncharacterized protein n=1 Tax=Puccinia graminis f. sp. tritici TaxID=56615 RepID=A0A5B0QLP2_PUCGR|nr:hypothetical protein PGTUg99_003818 [Puccinia graminis f. sp. tritici]